jgi:carboxypeptidase family protein
MKIFTTAAGCLLLTSFVSAECVVVQPLFQPSSQKVHIIALGDGKPLRDAKLEFFLATEKQSRLSLSTDQQGVVATPLLHPGLYRIVATAPGNLLAELYLDVSETSGKQAKSFVMDLTPVPPAVPTLTNLAIAEKTPVTERIQGFRGLVVDPVGAPIPGAEIQVLRKGSVGEIVVTLKSDEAGRFAAPLAGGTYVAFVRMLAFRTEVVGFEIAGGASAKSVRISMQIGRC